MNSVGENMLWHKLLSYKHIFYIHIWCIYTYACIYIYGYKVNMYAYIYNIGIYV